MADLLAFCLVCLKVGTMAFGGGMVMIPLMEKDVVGASWGLTHRQFVDAVALGQVTPGPLLVTATFIGYKVGMQGGGLPLALVGAVLATVCIFLPSFAMTIMASSQLQRMRHNPWVQGFLAGVKPAVVGLIAAAALSIGRTSLTDAPTWAIAALGLLLLIRFKADSAVIVIGSGLAGLAVCR